MTDKDAISAMRVQRDSAHKQRLHTETQNRVLAKHQADIRAWLADAIDQWATARLISTAAALAAGDEIHRQAIERLGEVERLTS